MILLDTDIVSLFHAGHSRVIERMLQVDAAEFIATSVLTEAEILRARYDYLLKAQDGEQLERAQQRLDSSAALLAEFRILPIDGNAASRFDELRAFKKLRKIGHADILIASIAPANNATLVTRNVRHFRQVPGLNVENWAD